MAEETPSLVKYVGSKVAFLVAHADKVTMPAHGGAAVVPFVGGGSIAAHYAMRGHRVIASDINARLINAHTCVQSSVDLVIEQIENIARDWRKAIEPFDGNERDAAGRVFFEEQRFKLEPRGDGDNYTRAARFLFVIRAGFNGLYRENEAGECNTAYGKPEPTADLVQAEKLRAYSAAIQGVEFLCEDFAVTCARALPGWSAYLDPPYEGTFTGYAGGDWSAKQACLPGMGASERDRLVAMLAYLDAIGVRFSVSDSDTPTTRRLYEQWRFDRVRRSGQVNSNPDDRGGVYEGLWRNHS